MKYALRFDSGLSIRLHHFSDGLYVRRRSCQHFYKLVKDIYIYIYVQPPVECKIRTTNSCLLQTAAYGLVNATAK